jgi:hypothetical protein
MESPDARLVEFVWHLTGRKLSLFSWPPPSCVTAADHRKAAVRRLAKVQTFDLG